MKTVTAFVMFVSLAAFATAQDDAQKRYIEDGKQQKKADESRLADRLKMFADEEAAIKKSKADTSNSSPSFSSGTDKNGKKYVTFSYSHLKDKQEVLKKTQDNIKATKQKLEETKKADYITPKLNPLELTVGQVGIVTVSDNQPVQYDAFQVIDKDNVIIKFSGELHWLHADTTGMVDGKRYSLDQIIHVKGTKTYKAAVGTKTVLVLEGFTPKN